MKRQVPNQPTSLTDDQASVIEELKADAPSVRVRRRRSALQAPHAFPEVSNQELLEANLEADDAEI